MTSHNMSHHIYIQIMESQITNLSWHAMKNSKKFKVFFSTKMF